MAVMTQQQQAALDMQMKQAYLQRQQQQQQMQATLEEQQAEKAQQQTQTQSQQQVKPVITWSSGGYGSGTSRNLYLSGQPFGTIQIPKSYQGREEEYIRMTFNPRGYVTPSQTTPELRQRAEAEARAKEEARSASIRQYQEEQRVLKGSFMGREAQARVYGGSAPAPVVGVEAAKQMERDAASSRGYFIESQYGDVMKNGKYGYYSKEPPKGHELAYGQQYDTWKSTPGQQIQQYVQERMDTSKLFPSSDIYNPYKAGVQELSIRQQDRYLKNVGSKLGYYPAQPGSRAYNQLSTFEQRKNDLYSGKISQQLMDMSDKLQNKMAGVIGYNQNSSPFTKGVYGFGSVFTSLPYIVGGSLASGEMIIRKPLEAPSKILKEGLPRFATQTTTQITTQPYETGGSLVGMYGLGKVGLLKSTIPKSITNKRISIGKPQGVMIEGKPQYVVPEPEIQTPGLVKVKPGLTQQESQIFATPAKGGLSTPYLRPTADDLGKIFKKHEIAGGDYIKTPYGSYQRFKITGETTSKLSNKPQIHGKVSKNPLESLKSSIEKRVRIETKVDMSPTKMIYKEVVPRELLTDITWDVNTGVFKQKFQGYPTAKPPKTPKNPEIAGRMFTKLSGQTIKSPRLMPYEQTGTYETAKMQQDLQAFLNLKAQEHINTQALKEPTPKQPGFNRKMVSNEVKNIFKEQKSPALKTKTRTEVKLQMREAPKPKQKLQTILRDKNVVIPGLGKLITEPIQKTPISLYKPIGKQSVKENQEQQQKLNQMQRQIMKPVYEYNKPQRMRRIPVLIPQQQQKQKQGVVSIPVYKQSQKQSENQINKLVLKSMYSPVQSPYIVPQPSLFVTQTQSQPSKIIHRQITETPQMLKYGEMTKPPLPFALSDLTRQIKPKRKVKRTYRPYTERAGVATPSEIISGRASQKKRSSRKTKKSRR